MQFKVVKENCCIRLAHIFDKRWEDRMAVLLSSGDTSHQIFQQQKICLVVTLRIRYFNNSKFDGTGFNSGEPVIRNLFQQQQFVSIYLNLLEKATYVSILRLL